MRKKRRPANKRGPVNCAIHEETPAAAFCRHCGRAVCEDCQKDRLGVPHCPACDEKLRALDPPDADSPAGAGESSASSGAAASRESPRGPGASSERPAYSSDGPLPVLAFILGLIPGVGAVYNGQYAKGVVHALLWGGLLGAAITSGQADQPGGVAVFVILLVLTTFYMPIEAVQTTRALRRGEELDDLSGLLGTSSPVGGAMLIVLGVVFLLHSLGYWRLADVVRFWPLTLIAFGAYILYRRVKEQASPRPAEKTSAGPPPRITPDPTGGGESFASRPPTAPAMDGPDEGGQGKAASAA